MVFKFAYFMELTKGYYPEKFQSCRFSVSSFTERLRKHNNDLITMLFHILGTQNFHVL